MTIPVCPYCGSNAEKVTGTTVYPHRKDLAHKVFWQCAPCSSWVGCHPGTETPLGRLANAELRTWKRKAHAAFDPLWRVKGNSKQKARARGAAYAALARLLGIPQAECHIGMFTVELCQRTIEVIPELRVQLERDRAAA